MPFQVLSASSYPMITGDIQTLNHSHTYRLGIENSVLGIEKRLAIFKA